MLDRSGRQTGVAEHQHGPGGAAPFQSGYDDADDDGRATDEHPRHRYVAGLVAVGAFTVQGWGRTDLAGLLFSVGALGGEVGFAVFAVPVLRPLGPKLLSASVCAVAAVESVLLGLVLDGEGFCGCPHRRRHSHCCGRRSSSPSSASCAGTAVCSGSAPSAPHSSPD